MTEDATIRPGIRTTEFWLALAVAVFGGLAALYANEPWAQVAGILAAALTSLGYGMTRAKAKSVAIAVQAR